MEALLPTTGVLVTAGGAIRSLTLGNTLGVPSRVPNCLGRARYRYRLGGEDQRRGEERDREREDEEEMG